MALTRSRSDGPRPGRGASASGHSPGARRRSDFVIPVFPAASRHLVGLDENIRAALERDFPVAYKQPKVTAAQRERVNQQREVRKSLEAIGADLDRVQEEALRLQGKVAKTEAAISAKEEELKA
mmetsp:Transcript_25429/g.73356  ORF Transcript_25429/g.73356 Transcript_25429/m.73356 type:complete len:124 (-) Transcript_25429:75-446(-)